MVDWENFKRKAGKVIEVGGMGHFDWSKFKFEDLFSKVISDNDIDRKIFYFAKIKEHTETLEKSKELIESQRKLKTHLENTGFISVLSGTVRGYEYYGLGGEKTLIFKEKGVDVRMAVDMVSWSCDKKVKRIILCSSDSDLQPAIAEIKSRGVECVYLGFESDPNKGMLYTADRAILIRDAELLMLVKS